MSRCGKRGNSAPGGRNLKRKDMQVQIPVTTWKQGEHNVIKEGE